MIITVKMKDGPVTTIDTEACSHSYAIREALELALKLDGCDESIIDQVFNREKGKPELDPLWCGQDLGSKLLKI